MELNTIFFIGPQGSGKGTQAKLLAEKLGFFHWDNGGILRETAKQETELGKEVKSLMDQGIYLSDELLMRVAKNKLENISAAEGVIFDGLPRRMSQAEFIINFLKGQGREHFVTIFLDIPKEESVSRIMLRAQKEGRTDDTREAVERRLQQYYDETLPMLDFMKQRGQFIEIDGRPAIEEVTKKIISSLGLPS